MKITKHIPNTITCLNLFSGSLAVYFAFHANYPAALLAILIAGVLDFLDGFAARVFKAYSSFGKELDSLADVISFGFAPGIIAFSLLEQSNLPDWLKFAGFIIPVFSALRLAKFNIDVNQTSSFIGVPTPANAILWVGLSFSYSYFMIEHPWVVLFSIVVTSYLLVSKLPMFSLKFKNLGWSQNKMQYLFLIGCIALLIIFRLDAFAPIILWYILSSAVMSRLIK